MAVWATTSLSELIERPEHVRTLSKEQIPAFLSQLGALQSVLAARLAAAESTPAPAQDSLVTVQDASTRLGLSCDWLYRNARKLPFTVRIGRHLRFSSSGIDRYIRAREGR